MKILQVCPLHLSDVAKKSFSTAGLLFISTSDYLSTQKKTNYNPLARPTWKCHHTNLWTAKLFHLTEGLLHSFKRWKLRKQPVVGCRGWLWKEPVVVCGNWNVGQATSQQVFRVTTFCVNTCFQSFATLISRIVHHVVLKFSSCRNKPQHVHINTGARPVACLGRSTRAMQIIGSIKRQ